MEMEKSSWSRVTPDVSSVELGKAVHGSPTKNGEPDGRRSQHALGNESSKKKGRGVKDMEQVMSSIYMPTGAY